MKHETEFKLTYKMTDTPSDYIHIVKRGDDWVCTCGGIECASGTYTEGRWNLLSWGGRNLTYLGQERSFTDLADLMIWMDDPNNW